jgi:uracil-DNA glycosylase family 4
VSSPPRAELLERLNARVVRCRACPRLVEHRETVAVTKRRAFRDDTYWGKPVPAFGDPAAKLLVVGLAPAQHGANRTGRMFTGDSSGDWLYRALHRARFASQPTSRSREDGLTLRSAYITAAARCAPPDNRPSVEELAACRPYLVAELAAFLVGATPGKPLVVLALGAIAHAAVLAALGDNGVTLPRPRPRFAHDAVTSLADGRVRLVDSYHPSRQNTQTGKLTEAMLDQALATAKRLTRR